jgi:hypothetical protein
MPVKDCATLEAEIAKGEPSRLLIEIALRQPLVGATAAYDSNEIQRAIREGFQEIAAQVEIQRLTKATHSSKSWVGRIVAFTFCAAVGSTVTVILSASHTQRSYALESLTPPSSGEAAASSEAPSPGSQSRGGPDAPAIAPSASLAGPATFGLHTQ